MLCKPRQQIEHLWVLVTWPHPDVGEAIMVNITTLRPHSADTTTVLDVGDHPFITHPSVVFYADARLVDPGDLDQAVAAGCGRTRGAFAPPVLARIQAGMERSPFTPNKVKEAYRAAAAAGLV